MSCKLPHKLERCKNVMMLDFGPESCHFRGHGNVGSVPQWNKEGAKCSIPCHNGWIWSQGEKRLVLSISKPVALSPCCVPDNSVSARSFLKAQVWWISAGDSMEKAEIVELKYMYFIDFEIFLEVCSAWDKNNYKPFDDFKTKEAAK